MPNGTTHTNKCKMQCKIRCDARSGCNALLLLDQVRTHRRACRHAPVRRPTVFSRLRPDDSGRPQTGPAGYGPLATSGHMLRYLAPAPTTAQVGNHNKAARSTIFSRCRVGKAVGVLSTAGTHWLIKMIFGAKVRQAQRLKTRIVTGTRARQRGAETMRSTDEEVRLFRKAKRSAVPPLRPKDQETALARNPLVENR